MSPLREKIFSERCYRIKSLKTKAEALKKICEGLIDKIERDGFDAYYSVNVGVDKLAASINDTCRCLHFLKQWEESLDSWEREKDKNREDLRGEDTSGTEDSCEGDKV
jgi:RNA binding exosome subunit